MQLRPKHHSQTNPIRVKATDEFGEVVIFQNVTELARYFDMSRAAIYIALKKGTLVRGCKLERV